jgi:hypothetical protein
MTVLLGVEMADACWGGGDVYAVVECRHGPISTRSYWTKCTRCRG